MNKRTQEPPTAAEVFSDIMQGKRRAAWPREHVAALVSAGLVEVVSLRPASLNPTIAFTAWASQQHENES